MNQHTTPQLPSDLSTIPDNAAVAELEARVATNGFDGNEEALANLAGHAARAGAPSETLRVLTNPVVGEALRASALLRIVDDWPYYQRRLADLERSDEPAHLELIDAWRQHEDLRLAGADVHELWASRRYLDAVRDGVREASVA